MSYCGDVKVSKAEIEVILRNMNRKGQNDNY